MDSWGWLEPRATEELWARQFGFNSDGGGGDNINNVDLRNGTNGMPRFSGGGGRNFTSAAINDFRFQAAKSIRTSTIILSVFNVIAAFATAVGILWDGYATAKRNNPKYTFRTSAFSCIRSPETFPLVLSCGIVIQGIVFAVAQSTGLKGRLVLGCTITSQMMLPAVFIVPYIQLVFGLEVVLRSLGRHIPFTPRGKWRVTICIAIVAMLLLVTYLVTHFIRPPNFCFASLFWFLQSYKRGSFVVLTFIAATLLACVAIIFIKLHRSARIDPTERVSASRMVYYLSLGFISNALLLPFFVDINFYTKRGSSGSALQFSMVASVVANVSGLMTGGLHVFLRSTTRATIGPRQEGEKKFEDDERESFKRGIRRYTPGGHEDDYRDPSPVGLRPVDTNDSLTSSSGKGTYEGDDQVYWDDRVNPLGSHAVFPAPAATTLPSPEPPQQRSNHAPKSSYSLFPGNNNGGSTAKLLSLLPAAVYDPTAKDTSAASSMLKPPAPTHGFGHRRDSSLASHTTVQIGLRFSNVDDIPPLHSKYYHDGNQVHNLECPPAMTDGGGDPAAKRPSPLSHMEEPPTNGGDSVEVCNDDDCDKGVEHKDCTLKPAVYKPPESPQAARIKVTSPKGVGFNIPLTRLASSSANPREAPSARRVDQSQLKKADWI